MSFVAGMVCSVCSVCCVLLTRYPVCVAHTSTFGIVRSFVRSFVCLLVLFVVSHSLFYIPSAKVVIYKEPPKRGSGPCTSLKWSTGTTDPVLFAGFSTGRLSTYKLISGAVERVNSVSLGIAVSPTNERTNE